MFNWFKKKPKSSQEEVEVTRQALDKTRTSLLSKIGRIFSGKNRIDEDLLEELEEALITSDVGMDTTEVIIDAMKSRAKKEGFEYTEDIDAEQNINGITIYYNLKMCCDKGGAQTRTLREVYHYIRCQLEYLLINNTIPVYFINILDGDECYRNKKKFNYLINNEKYSTIKNKVFIGDLNEYSNLWIKNNGNITQLINN